MKARAAFLILLGLGLGGVSGASAQECTPAPTMTIKIFNDETDKWLYPVISVGPKPGAAGDVWIQACFKIKNKDLNANTYRTTLVYRIYIEPEGVGIAPGKSVSITIPLYTQIAQVPNPALPNQYIEWWQGGRLELYANDKPEPPKELTEQFKNIFNPKLNRKPRPDQALFRAWPQPRSGLPTCEGCLQTLYFYSDTSDLPAWNPYQLFEFTLGAQIDSFKIGPDDVRNGLDIGNLDFDMSYVNIAHFGAALGPFQNNQVGFVGTPQPIADFIKSVNQFLADNPGWPRYIDPDQQVKDPGSPPKPTEPPKVASPLEVFLRLAGTLLFRLPICSRSRRTGPLCCGTLSKSCGQIGTDGA